MPVPIDARQFPHLLLSESNVWGARSASELIALDWSLGSEVGERTSEERFLCQFHALHFVGLRFALTPDFGTALSAIGARFLAPFSQKRMTGLAIKMVE